MLSASPRTPKNKVYGLVSDRDNVVRYIGQTTQTVKSRLSQHLQEAKRGKAATTKNTWIAQELEAGYKVSSITLFEECQVDVAEKAIIGMFVSVGHGLTNTTYIPRPVEPKPKPSKRPKKKKVRNDHEILPLPDDFDNREAAVWKFKTGATLPDMARHFQISLGRATKIYQQWALDISDEHYKMGKYLERDSNSKDHR